MNEIFKIRESGFDEIKKELIIKSVPFLVITLSFGIGIVYFKAENKEDIYSILPFMIPFLLFSISYGIFKGLKRQKMLFESYKVTFSENDIVREQSITPIVTIPFTDIQSIIKDKKGGYAIKGKSAVETIVIPAQIENPEKLETILHQLQPIEHFSQPTFEEKYRLPIMLVMLLCMATVYISFNKILVGICCVIVCTLLIRSFTQILASKNIDKKTKRSGYYSLVVLASVIAVTIMKIIL